VGHKQRRRGAVARHVGGRSGAGRGGLGAARPAGMPCRVAHGVCLAGTEQGRGGGRGLEREREKKSARLTVIYSKFCMET